MNKDDAEQVDEYYIRQNMYCRMGAGGGRVGRRVRGGIGESVGGGGG
jgi:hypothetical protein